MSDYVFLLLDVGFLYYVCWFYTNWRRESILIEVNKKLAKILGFIAYGNKLSIVSIILGLYAHVSMALLIILLIYDIVLKTNTDTKLLTKIWGLLAFILGVFGEEVETCIKIKRAENVKHRIEFSLLAVFIFAGWLYIIYLFIGYVWFFMDTCG